MNYWGNIISNNFSKSILTLIHLFFRAVHNGCQKQFSDICDLGEFRRFIIPPYSVLTTGKIVESRKKMADAVMRKRGMKQRTISEVIFGICWINK